MAKKLRTVIVGAGAGGLSSAIHLAMRGHAVTVFESNEKVGGRANLIEFDGFRFDTGPSLLNYPWVFDDLFKAAGSSLTDELDLVRVDPAIKFSWPDGEEFQLSSDLTKLSAECRRLNPADGLGLLRFLEDSRHKYRVSFDRLVTRNADSPLSWFASAGISELFKLGLFHSMDSQIGRYFKSRRTREAFGSYGMYLGGAPYDLPGIFSILPFGELEYGLWLPRGGMYSLSEAMLCAAQQVGVDVQTGTPVSSIDASDGSVSGVTLENGEKVPAEVVISNVDVPTTLTRLLKAKPEHTKRYKPPRMTPGVITYYLAIDRPLNEIGHHQVFLPRDVRHAYRQLMDEGKVPDDLPFYASVASNTDPSLAPGGKSALFLLAPVPLLSELGDTGLDALAEKLRQQMFERMAQHGIKISESDVIGQQVMTPADWSDQFGLFDGSAFGAAHNLRQIGPFRQRNASKQVNGLFFAGASTTPGTGVPMCVLSGKMAAERVDEWIAASEGAA